MGNKIHVKNKIKSKQEYNSGTMKGILLTKSKLDLCIVIKNSQTI